MSDLVLGLDLGGTAIKIALLRGGEVVVDTRLPNRSMPSDLDRVADAAQELIKVHGDPVRVGIAVPGIVDPAGTRLVSAHGKYGYALGLDLTAWSATRLGLPARVENDARAALLGEVSSGCAVGATDAVLLVAGTGIGTAAMIDGHLVRGHRGYAGILGGHLSIAEADAACNCGNLDCAELSGGSWNLPAGQSLSSVFAERATGDPAAIVLSNQILRAWAVTAVSLCHSYDPATVIITGGGVAAAGPLALHHLTRYVHDHLWSSMPRPSLLIADRPALSVVRGLEALT